jgi:hypothetical protein
VTHFLSHLLHVCGPPDANTALLLSGQPLQWTQEVTYLGVATKRSRTPGKTLPLELPRLWAALYKTGAALSPAVPVPLAAQLQLVTADVLAGVLYPAAVHDLDYTRTDRFVTNLIRRLAGCAKGSSAAFLQCETGTVPSKFTAHRRVVQYWLHVSHDSWFAPLLSDFRGQGPLRRLQNTAALYGFTRTTELSGGRTYPTSKEVWHKRVRDAVADAAARFLRAKAVERKLPGPAVIAKRNNLLKLVAQPYVLEGADLAQYGVAFRQSAVSGRFREWDPRHCRPCPHCNKPGHFADPCHLLAFFVTDWPLTKSGVPGLVPL